MTDINREARLRNLNPEIAYECLIRYRTLRETGKKPRRAHTLTTAYADKRFGIFPKGWDYASLAQDYLGD